MFPPVGRLPGAGAERRRSLPWLGYPDGIVRGGMPARRHRLLRPSPVPPSVPLFPPLSTPVTRVREGPKGPRSNPLTTTPPPLRTCSVPIGLSAASGGGFVSQTRPVVASARGSARMALMVVPRLPSRDPPSSGPGCYSSPARCSSTRGRRWSSLTLGENPRHRAGQIRDICCRMRKANRPRRWDRPGGWPGPGRPGK